jgi:phosphate transport system substrate-binding protein
MLTKWRSAPRWALCVAVCAALWGCEGSRGGQERLVLTGSSTIAPLAGELGRRFEAANPGVRVDVQTGGSSRGIADVRRGTAQLGMVSRALHPEEGDLRAHLIALDGVSLILHKDNPVQALSDAQVASIYRGEVTRWSALGGADAPITVVQKAEGRSTLELFLEHFRLKREEVKASVVIGDNQQGILTVAGDPNAIGYVSIGTAAYESSRGTAIKLLPMGGVEATLAQVRARRFPLARPLHLVTRGEEAPLVRRFVEFAQSAAVDDLIEAQYFVPPTR